MPAILDQTTLQQSKNQGGDTFDESASQSGSRRTTAPSTSVMSLAVERRRPVSIS